ncbi:MAG TPA: thiosulfate sulfurtransferase GlpE [Pseudomonadales bacterium]|nr:thiosulfate sulfurtransferase GlpE [Pseudomonadales bacterium]
MSFTCIAGSAAKQMMESREVTIIDIRDPGSFASAHVTGAISVNNSNVNEFLAQADFEKPLLVFCYHGHSSQGAADFFGNQGFVEVYSVDGGFEEWRVTYPVDQTS